MPGRDHPPRIPRRVELTAENRRMLCVPKGFAHGFITLVDDTEAFCLVDESHAPEF